MRYIVTRSSDCAGKKQPCKKAYQNGQEDEFHRKLWFVDIETIDDLRALMVESNEPIILIDGDYGDEIEIYDSYRE